MGIDPAVGVLHPPLGIGGWVRPIVELQRTPATARHQRKVERRGDQQDRAALRAHDPPIVPQACRHHHQYFWYAIIRFFDTPAAVRQGATSPWRRYPDLRNPSKSVRRKVVLSRGIRPAREILP